MHHHALAPVSLDPGDFWHSWELLFQSFSVGLIFIRMNWAGEVQLAQKPPWRHPLFHERRSDAYCISFQDPPGRRHQNPFNLFVRWRNPDTKVDHPTNQWTAKVPQLWSPGCSLLPASGQLWPLRQPHIHTCCETRTNGQIWEIAKNAWESNQPCHVFSGPVCFVWISLEQTPHRGQDVSSLPTKADPGAILPDPDVCIFRAREDESAIRRVMAAEHSPFWTGWHSRKATLGG